MLYAGGVCYHARMVSTTEVSSDKLKLKIKSISSVIGQPTTSGLYLLPRSSHDQGLFRSILASVMRLEPSLVWPTDFWSQFSFEVVAIPSPFLDILPSGSVPGYLKAHLLARLRWRTQGGCPPGFSSVRLGVKRYLPPLWASLLSSRIDTKPSLVQGVPRNSTGALFRLQHRGSLFRE